MLRVHVAPALPVLADRLAARLREGRADPFTAATVVAPRRGVRAWVQLGLAERLGIAANLRFVYLDGLLRHLVPAKRRGSVRVLEPDVLESAVRAVLARAELLARPTCAGLRAYLEVDGADADHLERRRCELARALARCFGDYALHRPELLAAWRERRAALEPGAELAPVEAWQAEVWREVLGADGRVVVGAVPAPEAEPALAPDGGAEAEPVAWIDRTRLLEALAEDERPREPLHVFGFSTLAPGHRRLLVDLADGLDVDLYLLAPRCAGGAPGAAWAEPALEHVAAWRALAGERPDRVTLDPAPAASVDLTLDVVKGATLGVRPSGSAAGRASTAGGPGGPALQVLACPSLQREVEAAAAEVWRAVRTSAEAGAPLRFDEVAVAVVDARWDAYRGRLRHVFRAAHRLPSSFLELPAAEESRLVEAALLLLDLPLGRFGRDDLLRLMTHPCLQARIPEADPEGWLTWAEELLVLRGADRADLAETYVTRDLYTFGQGARRLALGAFFDPDPGAPVVTIEDQPYLPHPLAPGEAASAGRFLLLVRSLVADLRRVRAAQLPLAAWGGLLRSLVGAYLAPRDDDPSGLGRVLGPLERLASLDLDGRPVPYRVAHALIRARLEEVRVTSGQPLCEGVVVGPLSALAGLPFRAVFVLGLQEGAFPAPPVRDLLDLRLAAPQPGDVSPAARDRLDFLLTLLGAGERLTLSYVARDELTGEALAPSPLVPALAALLPAGAAPARPPLRRYAAAAFPPPLGEGDGEAREVLPAARAEAQARALREELSGLLPAGAGWPRDPLGLLDPAARSALGPVLAEARPPPPRPAPADEVLRLPLRAVRDFLSSPLQAWGEHCVGFRQDEGLADLLGRTDEPFATDVLGTTVLLREALHAGVAAADASGPPPLADDAEVDAARAALEPIVDEAYAALLPRAELQGRVPTGVFLDVQRRRHRAVLATWCRNLVRWPGLAAVRGLRVHRFGQATARGASDVLAPPLELDVPLPGRARPLRVQLHGATGRVLPGARGTLQLTLGQASHRHHLRAFVDHVVLAAAGVPLDPGAFRAVVCPGSGWANLEAAKHHCAFRPFGRDEARAYLAQLLADLLGGPHAYLFPLEVTAAYLLERQRKGPPDVPLTEAIARSRANPFRRDDSDDWGPVPHPERFAPPDAAEALAEARLGPFVTRRVAPEEAGP